jgi:hypothetical protein
MKETITALIIILLFYSCNLKKTELNNDNQPLKSELSTDSIPPTKIDEIKSELYTDSIPPTKIDGMRSLSFKFNTDSSGIILKTINVYSENKQIQKIVVDKVIERLNFELIDCNFDGYKDISVLDNCGSGGCAYLIWNYSSKKNRYIYNEKLSQILGLEIDTVNQYIVFHYRAGFPEEMWDSLKYINNKLSFVKGRYRERWQDSLGNSWEKNTYTRKINNVLITEVDSFVTK